MLRLRDVLRLDLIQHGKSTHNMEAVFVLGTLLFTVLLLTGALHRRCRWSSPPIDACCSGSAPLVLFFAAIGLGFMLVETSQMQRLIVVLGHPTYGLTVVLFSLLLASGIGSWLTTRLRGDRRRTRRRLMRGGAASSRALRCSVSVTPAAGASHRRREHARCASPSRRWCWRCPAC